MSIHHLSRVWEDHSIRSRAHLLVLLAIADYARSDGKAWPSIDSLSKKSRLSHRGVQDAISALILQKKLLVETAAGPFGTNIYTVTDGGCKSCTPADTRRKTRTDFRRPSAPNPSGTVINGKEGERNSPQFPKDFKILIDAAKESREILKREAANESPHGLDWSDNDKRLQFLELGKKIKAWRNRLNQMEI